MQDDDSTPEMPPDFGDEPEEGTSIEELEENAPRCTDAANADAIRHAHGRGYRYVCKWAAWLAWDGRRWALEGARERVINAALLTAREEHTRTRTRLRVLEEELRVNALASKKDEDLDIKVKYELKLLKHHEQSQNASKLEAAIKVLATQLQVTIAELDRDPWLLNVANGTIDLRTAELRSHDPEDLITQITDVEWDDDARAPTWEAFVSGVMGGDLQLAMYLQRLVGYSLTGLTTEHALAFFYGGGRNGKSTFVNTVRTMLGEYACAAPRDLLFQRRGEGHPTDLARLYGKRLAVCAEIGEHTVLDEAKVKDLTGGDAVSVRRMREDFWDLIPTHKLLISGNHKPHVQGDDLGIWRRIRLVPWSVTVDIAAVDKDLPTKLRAELVGILRWAVMGCLEWARVGLAEPEAIQRATSEYREENDALREFLATYVVFGPSERCSRSELRDKYDAWCEETGQTPFGARKVGQRLREHGVEGAHVRVGTSVKNGWKGCRLRTNYEIEVNTPIEDGPGGVRGTA